MPVKIRGGTANHGEPSLCLTCRWATVIKGIALREEVIECGQLSSDHNRITFPVTFCTGYVDRRRPSLREMEDMAWVLRSDPKRNQIGFVRAAELRLKDRFVLADDDWLD